MVFILFCKDNLGITGSSGKRISSYNTPGGFQMSIDFQSFMGKKRDDFTKEETGATIMDY
jgi:hypothetical protein